MRLIEYLKSSPKDKGDNVAEKKNEPNQKKNTGKGGAVGKNKGKDNGTRNLVIGMILLVVLAGAGSAIAKNRTNTHAALPSDVSVSEGYGISFNPKAPVKLDVYEDFQCPHCRDFEAVNGNYINSLVRANKMHVVFHPITLLGPESALTAAASACASDQGKFLDYHMALYKNQPTAENSGYWTNEKLALIGHSIGITSAKFDTCINTGKYATWATNVETDATAKNINSTPTVLLNGKSIPPQAEQDLASLKNLFKAVGVK